jgi:hypothetical protein
LRIHRLLPLLVLCLAVLPAAAARAAEDEAELLHSYTPAGWGLSIGLPDYGQVYQPGDPSWAADADLDWEWLSQIDDTITVPLYRIDGQTIHLAGPDGAETTVSDAQFEAYYAALVKEWSNSATFTLLGSEQDYPGADGQLWHMFNLHETAAAGPLDYYVLLGRDDDNMLRMISFYYAPTDDAEMQDAILGMVMLHLDPSLLDEE